MSRAFALLLVTWALVEVTYLPDRLVCAVPSPEPAQRTGHARLFEQLLLDNDRLHCCANARLVACRGAVLEMRTTSRDPLLAATE